MNGELARALAAGAGVLSSGELRHLRHAIRHAWRAGHLVRIHRGIYAAVVDHEIRWRAALAYLGGQAVLSHLSALSLWGLIPADPAAPVHATVPPQVRRLGDAGLVVHRRSHSRCLVRRGFPVTVLEASVVDSWPLLPVHERRAPVIEAVASRRTTVDRLRSQLARAARVPGRATLTRLLDLLDKGCRSPLEIWGLEQVFTGDGMPPFERQVRVRIGDRSVYLDVYAAAERVNFELDGSAGHSAPGDRERDLRRDAALAALGILVVRFTYRRLVQEPAAVRREVSEILAARREAKIIAR